MPRVLRARLELKGYLVHRVRLGRPVQPALRAHLDLKVFRALRERMAPPGPMARWALPVRKVMSALPVRKVCQVHKAYRARSSG